MLHTKWRGVVLAMAAMTATLSLTSCIDEDLSECGKDYTVDYTVHLRTDISTEIGSEFAAGSPEQAFGERLKGALSDVFTDRARDINLSFYTDDQRLAQHEQHQMDASQASYTLYLPAKNYKHLAIANADAEPLVDITGTEQLASLAMTQNTADTIDSHRVGLFSARLPMAVENREQHFNVNLYMQNCASCLVINPGNANPTEIWGYVDGMATAFQLNDSTYQFNRNTVVRANQLQESGLFGLYAATFPSRDRIAADNAQTTAAQDAADQRALWHIYVYVRMNGKVTQTVLSVSDPLCAGQLRIIRGVLKDDGSIATNTQNVGVSVKLDWKPGGQHDIEV